MMGKIGIWKNNLVFSLHYHDHQRMRKRKNNATRTYVFFVLFLYHYTSSFWGVADPDVTELDRKIGKFLVGNFGEREHCEPVYH